MRLEACTATRPPTFGMMIFLLLLLPPLLSKCCCRNSGKQNWIIRECLIRLNYSFTELLLLRSKNKWNINDNKSSVGKCINSTSTESSDHINSVFRTNELPSDRAQFLIINLEASWKKNQINCPTTIQSRTFSFTSASIINCTEYIHWRWKKKMLSRERTYTMNSKIEWYRVTFSYIFSLFSQFINLLFGFRHVGIGLNTTHK